jgi:cobalt-zinc-cadmium efflux system outer membrane protein
MRSLPLLLLACTAGCHTISALNSPNLPEQNSLAQPASNTSARTVSYDAPADAATSTLPPVQTATPQDDPPRRRFEIPAELPGADSARISLPPMDPSLPIEQRKSLAESLFPDLTPAAAQETPATAETPITLAELQKIAEEQSPVVRQAAAVVQSSRGKATQAGLKPNPTLGYEGDTIGTADTAGYNGVFFTQEIVRGGKLSLAQSAAMQEVRAAEADLKKARISLASDVRRNYYKVLIAQEQLRFSKAISRLSDEVYKAQIDLVAGGEAAPYEPLQLRVFAVQARNNVTASANSLNAAWRQLAAAAGTPMMGRRVVAGSVENSTTSLNYEQAVAMLQNHSDIAAAQARVNAAAGNLRLQEAMPIPNLNLYGAFQHDDTTPLSNFSANVQVSAPVPVLNRNQGNIASAHADLIRARQDMVQVNNNLLSQLADNFSRYETSRVVSISYRTDIVPDQVRVYRGIYDRFLVDGQSVDFAQVVVSQQTLAQVVDSYVVSLSNEWNSLVDVAQLLQVTDLQTMDGAAVSSSPPAAPPADSAALPLPDVR